MVPHQNKTSLICVNYDCFLDANSNPKAFESLLSFEHYQESSPSFPDEVFGALAELNPHVNPETLRLNVSKTVPALEREKVIHWHPGLLTKAEKYRGPSGALAIVPKVLREKSATEDAGVEYFKEKYDAIDKAGVSPQELDTHVLIQCFSFIFYFGIFDLSRTASLLC